MICVNVFLFVNIFRPQSLKHISPGMKRGPPIAKRKSSPSPRLRSVTSPHRSLSHRSKPESPVSIDRYHLSCSCLNTAGLVQTRMKLNNGWNKKDVKFEKWQISLEFLMKHPIWLFWNSRYMLQSWFLSWNTLGLPQINRIRDEGCKQKTFHCQEVFQQLK